MNKYDIIKRIENFAPLETAESWDCAGWGIETNRQQVHKVMLALTVTNDVVRQARKQKCDMIISHHPLFFAPLDFKGIDIYSAHTNLDLADGGTTDVLLKKIGLHKDVFADGFLRYIECKTSVKDLLKILKQISPNLRYINNKNIQILNKIAFCAGSGADFISEAQKNGADAFVTGDLKFHTALDSSIVIYDIGHFESEIFVLSIFEKLLHNDVEIIYADEASPFKYN